MGFSTLLDIMGSIVIGGMLLMILLRLNDASVRNSYIFNGDAILQENLVEVVKLIEFDFRQMGYTSNWATADPSAPAITFADSTSISFLVDGSIINYSVGPKSELLGTPNPNDRMLYRSVNGGTPLGSNMGITKFDLSYYKIFGDTIPMPVPTSQLGEIETIQIDIEIEDVYGYDTTYAKTAWRQIRMSSRNKNKR